MVIHDKIPDEHIRFTSKINGMNNNMLKLEGLKWENNLEGSISNFTYSREPKTYFTYL